MNWKAKPLPSSIASLWKNLEDIAKEVEKPESVLSIFDDDFIKEEYNKNNTFIDFSIISKKEQRTIDISFRNLTSCTFNFYSVDLELLFSQSPFEGNDQTALSKLINLIYPNEILKVSLPKESSAPPDKKYKPTDGNIHHYIDLPNNYKGTNCIIEIVGDDNKTKAVHNLKKPISGAYIKVYSKNKNETKFYKDGYTDIRGRFQYKKSSKNQLTDSSELSMFVKTETCGSTVINIKI